MLTVEERIVGNLEIELDYTTALKDLTNTLERFKQDGYTKSFFESFALNSVKNTSTALQCWEKYFSRGFKRLERGRLVSGKDQSLPSTPVVIDISEPDILPSLVRLYEDYSKASGTKYGWSVHGHYKYSGRVIGICLDQEGFYIS